MKTKPIKKEGVDDQKSACGLCGKNNKTCQKTECCDNWICGDENDLYVVFL